MQPEPAELGQRIRGQTVDGLFAALPFFIAGIISSFSEQLGASLLYFAIPYFFFYVIFCDGFRGGQSYGKRVLRMVVVDKTTGKPCSYLQSVLRNTPLCFLGILDWIFVLGKEKQRLGDMLANTIVVKKIQ
jgi:uncharacterized RDD family membrane protein YckC